MFISSVNTAMSTETITKLHASSSGEVQDTYRQIKLWL